ncbi:hypothetical protein [Limnobacter sp.]|uniref:hypothetical protein n=1 Tax=Limnobacter sp. TaxID=2003368 RepID=UPI002FDF7D5C
MTLDYFMSAAWEYTVVYFVYTGLLIPVSTYFLAFAVPKAIVSKYFRQPHFNDGDDELFELFPFRYYLTLWIAQLTACKWFAHRRKAYDLRKDSPTYWLVISWVYFWLIFIPPIAAFFLSLICFGYFELTGRPVPQV